MNRVQETNKLCKRCSKKATYTWCCPAIDLYMASVQINFETIMLKQTLRTKRSRDDLSWYVPSEVELNENLNLCVGMVSCTRAVRLQWEMSLDRHDLHEETIQGMLKRKDDDLAFGAAKRIELDEQNKEQSFFAWLVESMEQMESMRTYSVNVPPTNDLTLPNHGQ